jgi:5-bromo-4-chloroindolyl phosphate hydrolysis protein
VKIKPGEDKMRSFSRIGMVLLSSIIALSLGVAFAENQTASKETVNVSEPMNISSATMNIKDIQNVVKDLQNITKQLQDVTKQLLNASQLQNFTQLQNTTQLQNATNQLQNATNKLQNATNPFAKVKGKPPVGAGHR